MIATKIVYLILVLFPTFSWATSPLPSCVADLTPAVNCRNFNGYKPCKLNDICSSQCPQFAAIGKRIAIVHLEALGAVLRSTALLPAIRRAYPDAIITWITKAPGNLLLANNPLIDRLLTVNAEDLLAIKALEFDLAFVIDKSLVSSGIAREMKVEEIRGFVADPRNGAIIPANPEAEELWKLGLSNHLKFNVNKKSEIELTHQALKLGDYAVDDYQVFLSPAEQSLAKERRMSWSEGGSKKVIGLNTGCSAVGVPYKKMSVEGQRQLIDKMKSDSRFRDVNVVLLGGKEDTERNAQIAKGLAVLESPSTLGLRDGLASVAAVDAVFTGDSLGMHMAIGLKKQVVAWFGPTCAHEIELFGRGEAVISKAPCGPCWSRSCSKPVMCYDQIDHNEVLNALDRALRRNF
jgi:heptosyltransferase II